MTLTDSTTATAAQRASLPTIIQGGMGVAVSSWHLAKTVSQAGQLGVVSGTALDVVVARRLQDGDTDGSIRRALSHFPIPEMAQRILDRYFKPEGRTKPTYAPSPTLGLNPSVNANELSIVANFVEVWLAKEGHDGVIGINFLEKVQMATPPAAYGAMLANVDYVLMGAGIPAEIPAMLDKLANHEFASISVDVDFATQKYEIELDPQTLTELKLPPLHRPTFLAIVSSHILAAFLYRVEATRPDGFVIEGPTAGGHNTPPRAKDSIDEDGQSIFGPRDEADLVKLAAIGLPFWLAGGRSTPNMVADAISHGATGVQVGTTFALSLDSGFTDLVRDELITKLREESFVVRTDALASPTGFPFKVATVEGTMSEEAVYEARPRLCDLGYLRVPYERTPGVVGYRCPSEPVHMYIKKKGEESETVGRKCLCNGLMASIGLGQIRPDGYEEPRLVTMGSDLSGAKELIKKYPHGWTATQAIEYMLSAIKA
jgi:NAD(P)H-dependent flavin oxidoreductase YrpB (nitropropane dioxygenase family)